MTRVRQVGDGASPRFLAGPRNDAVVGMWLEWAGLGIQSLAGAFEKATRGLVTVTVALGMVGQIDCGYERSASGVDVAVRLFPCNVEPAAETLR